MGIRTIRYDKLVRDRIPEIIESDGKTAEIEILDDREYRRCLDEKLGEELNEYLESGKLEELADIMEVIYALVDLEGTSRDEFERIRAEKEADRGGFSKRFFLKEVRIEDK
jgi:predicted house-cleaning noncanonical NTP pyrophosphatase (MazG superfamily)